MDLFELARAIEHDRDRAREHTIRIRRLLAPRADPPAVSPRTDDGRAGDRRVPHVAARPGSPR